VSEDIAAKCDILERLVAEFKTRISFLPTFAYEAPEEALNLMRLVCTHVTGVVTLARADFNLLPSAEIAARAAYEASVRAAWMLTPSTHFEQEARWATHLRGRVKAHRRTRSCTRSALTSYTGDAARYWGA
jgi:hypothetical protein